MDPKQLERMKVVVRMLSENDRPWLAVQVLWVSFKIERLKAAKVRHNRKHAKLTKQAIALLNEVQVEGFRIDLKNL